LKRDNIYLTNSCTIIWMSRDKIIYIFSLFLAILLLYILISPLIRIEAKEKINLENVPLLFVKSIYGLNSSSSILCSSFEKDIEEDNVRQLIKELKETANILLNLSLSYEIGEGELGKRLRKASSSYSLVSLSAAEVANSSLEIDAAREEIEHALDLLLECKVYDALGYWRKAKPHVMMAREEISKALLDLSKVNKEDLLSKKHRKILGGRIEELTSISEMLEELVKLFDIVEKYPDAIEKLCYASKSGKCAQIPEGLKGKLAEALSKLCPCKGGRYGYEISKIKSLLKYLEEKQGNGGSGAGYGAPSSDD